MDAAKKIQLVKLLGMIGSDHDGEVLNAARLAQRLLGSLGISWEELLTGSGNGRAEYDEGYRVGYAAGHQNGMRVAMQTRPEPMTRRMTWFTFARDLQENYYDNLSDWEQGFVDNWCDRHWNNPSPKQRGVFERIADKLGIDCPEA